MNVFSRALQISHTNQSVHDVLRHLQRVRGNRRRKHQTDNRTLLRGRWRLQHPADHRLSAGAVDFAQLGARSEVPRASLDDSKYIYGRGTGYYVLLSRLGLAAVERSAFDSQVGEFSAVLQRNHICDRGDRRGYASREQYEITAAFCGNLRGSQQRNVRRNSHLHSARISRLRQVSGSDAR